MKKNFLIIIVIVFANMQITAQVYDLNQLFINKYIDTLNYVRNPSFEEYTECPSTIDRLNKCKYWGRVPGAVLHSPNYFHRCANEFERFREVTVGVPNNSFGYQEPRTGNAYIGFGTFSRNYYTENVQTQLKKPLIKGKTYMIGMYVSLSKKSKYANDRFTFCLTRKPELEIKYKRYRGSSKMHLVCPNGIMYKSDTLITDTINWVNIEVDYTAMGGEEFLTIGVFDGDISWWERLRKRRNIFNEKFKYKVPGAHYYIDDVYVIRKEDYLNMKQYDEVE